MDAEAMPGYGRRKGSDGELLAAAGRGDREALRLIVERHQGLVRRIAGGLHDPRGSEELEDLVQVGMVGLLEAVRRFDSCRGAFGPYAGATISGVIKRHFRDRSWAIRIPRPLHDTAMVVKLRTSELEGSLGRAPTDGELADATGLEIGIVREVRHLHSSARPRSLHASIGDSELGELIGGDDPDLARAELRATISRLSADLSGGDRELLVRSFGLGQPQAAIAERVGGSQMRVSRRLRRVLGELEQRARSGNATASAQRCADGRRPTRAV
jgi:RNA polymerase sigma-B factor